MKKISDRFRIQNSLLMYLTSKISLCTICLCTYFILSVHSIIHLNIIIYRRNKCIKTNYLLAISKYVLLLFLCSLVLTYLLRLIRWKFLSFVDFLNSTYYMMWTLRALNPNWHEGGHFRPPCPFWITFNQKNFYQKFPNF